MKKLQKRLLTQPNLYFSLLAKPTSETLWIIKSSGLDRHLAQMVNPQSPWFCTLWPIWEQQACKGNDYLSELLDLISKDFTQKQGRTFRILNADLLRMRLLSSTPGSFPFSPVMIQERLLDFLPNTLFLADLEELAVISFTPEELIPLSHSFSDQTLQPHSLRYLQNLFPAQKQQDILSVLAYIAKNYPLLETCRSAYALMLSLNDPELWGQHKLCQRLVYNRLTDYHELQRSITLV